MPLIQHTINSTTDLLTVLPNIYGKRKHIVWFRGHHVDSWKLEPSIMRPPNNVSDEINLMKRFKQQGYPFLDRIPQREWEWMFIMQHFGVQTRLLDWSESPLVSLYFAVSPGQKPKDARQPAALWCLYPLKLNKLANVNLQGKSEIPCFGDDDDLLDGYLPSRVVGVHAAAPLPLAIIAPRQFKRLDAQRGVFTISHRNVTAIEDLGNQEHLVKINVPAAAKKTILGELESLGINELSLFPELATVGKLVASQ